MNQTPSTAPMVVLPVSRVVFAILSRTFVRATTMATVVPQIAILGIIGCARTRVILTAGIDLSVGAIAVLSSVLMGQPTFRHGIPAPAAIVPGRALGTAMGAIDGLLVSA
ncbi:hypothetical protein [Albidovulum sp.]|uniref:hypothetical protein n=1 Tax=Albidovulum sp. TaxID=1872424 RepID=UPI00352866D4